MNYMIAFYGREVFAVDYQSALMVAIALAKSYTEVTIWQGSTIKWQYKNK